MSALLFFAALAGFGTASAQDSVDADNVMFSSCDGYAKPGHNDGYLTGAVIFGIGSASTDIRPVGRISMGAAGAQACDAALANPLLKPEFTYRRSHLMLAKALHLVAAAKPAEALAVLDSEQVAAGSDPLREKGFGIASNEIRALALAMLGRKDEALDRLQAIETVRPYAITNREFVRHVRFRIDSSVDGYLDGVRKLAPIDPGVVLPAMVVSLQLGRFDDVLALGRGLTVALPAMRGNWRLSPGATTDYDVISIHARIAGIIAYAQAAKGDANGAAAGLDALSQLIDVYTARPEDPPAGDHWSRSVADDYNHRLAGGGAARMILDGWRSAIALRQLAPTFTSLDFQKRIKEVSPEIRPMVWLDVAGQVGLLKAGEDVAVQKALAQARAQVVGGLVLHMAIDYGNVLEHFPKAETPGDQPRVHKAGDGYFLSDNGFSSRAMNSPGEWTVRFASQLGTTASIEEQAIGAMANLAKSKGLDRFVIESRREFERVTNVMQWGRVIRRENAGHEVQFAVRLLGPGALPPDLVGAEWRVINADSVLAGFSAPVASADGARTK